MKVPKVNYKKAAVKAKDYELKIEFNGIPRNVFECGEKIPVKVVSQKKTPFKVEAVDQNGTVFSNMDTSLWKEGEYTIRCIAGGKKVAEKKI